MSEDNRYCDWYICNICTDLLCEPVSLQCGHNFCKECLPNPLYTCPVCRSSCSLFRYVNKNLEKIIQEKYPENYKERIQYILDHKTKNAIKNWLPNHEYYKKINNLIHNWFEITKGSKCSFTDMYNTINNKSELDIKLTYAIWLTYISENYGYTSLPFAVLPLSMIPYNDKREIDLRCYTDLYNKTKDPIFIKYIKNLGENIEDNQIDITADSLLIDYVIDNYEELKSKYSDMTTKLTNMSLNNSSDNNSSNTDTETRHTILPFPLDSLQPIINNTIENTDTNIHTLLGVIFERNRPS